MLDAASQRKLHDLHVAGDPTASARIAEALFEPLLDKLRKGNRRIEEDLLAEAAIDAWIGYLKEPNKFDPGKRSLLGYLLMAATGDLRNALHKLGRRSEREVSLDSFTDVELARHAGNKEERANEEAVTRLDAGSMARQVAVIFRDPQDQQLAKLVIEQERKTEAYARILGLEGLPVEAQRRQVKRHKDRIKKRLNRHGRDTARKR
jgi:hypothetical protein